MPTLRAAAELLSKADSIDALEPIATALHCAGGLFLDRDALRSLGMDDAVVEARVAQGTGAIRALLAVVGGDALLRDVLPQIAARLASRAPHVLWIVVATQPARGEVAIAAWGGARRPPRVVALVADRARLMDSDGETLRALAAAAGSRDVLTHARWVEVLGRDSLTVRFYRGLERAIGAIADSSRVGNAAERNEIALLDTSRLLFLSFLEAKGWLDGNRAFLTSRFDACAAHGGRFHDRVLRPLFFGTLNTPVRRRADAARRFGSIPFLNGGLFSRTPLERRLRGLAFSDDAYGALLYDLFGQYRFTAREETTSWSEAAIDPEMLGKAFESLMVSAERRRTGAFFTPFSLVERVAASGLELVACGDRASLERITVLDPACGSGAFLVHVLERVAGHLAECGDARDVSTIRRDVLTRSIFGVDVNPTAVWLCQLRLWLSVVIESGEEDPASVVPLPNLDRNVRAGDALSGSSFADLGVAKNGAVVLRRVRERYTRATGARKESLGRQLDRIERSRAVAAIDAELQTIAARRRDLLSAQRGRDLFGDRYRPSRDERHVAATLRVRAAALRGARRRIAAGGALPFSFPVHFADVAARGGFQLVLGNPPWVRLHRIPVEQRAAFRRDFEVARSAAWEAGAGPSGAGRGFAAQVDVAALFVERSIRLLAPGGAIALLVPAKLWRSLAGGGVRRLIETDTRVRRIEDYSEAPAVFDAAVYPSLVAATCHPERREGPLCAEDSCVHVAVHHTGHTAFAWQSKESSLKFDDTPGAPWILLPPDARRAFDCLRRIGRPLAQSVSGRPHLGVKCGCNDAFLVELVDVHGDVADVVSADGIAMTIERALIRPLIRGDRLARWRVPESYESVIWTHDDSDAPLATLPPLAARWFARWRHALVNRTDARHRARWWSLFRTESARFDRPRVVWGDVGRQPRASVLLAGDPRVPLNSCYVARCRDACDAHALAALLNGPLARAWLNALAEPARGGYRRYLGWTLSLLPTPADWDRARELLAPIGERAANGGAPPSETELLDAALEAYGVDHDDVAPLVAWLAT